MEKKSFAVISHVRGSGMLKGAWLGFDQISEGDHSMSNGGLCLSHL
jgi:hypothetical protein